MDEHDEVGSVTSVSESSTVTVTGVRGEETPIESLRGEQIEGSFVEGDGGEIMVEVVGSDVLVDGVSAHGEELLTNGEVAEMGTFDGGGVANRLSEARGLGDHMQEDCPQARAEELQGSTGVSVEDVPDTAGGSKAGIVPRASSEFGDAVVSKKVEVGIGEEGELVEESVRGGIDSTERCDVPGKLTSETVNILDIGENHGIEAGIVSSFPLQESTSVQTQVIEEDIASMSTGEILSSKGETQVYIVANVSLPTSEEDRTSLSTPVCQAANKDVPTAANEETFDQEPKPALGEEVGMINEKEASHLEVKVAEANLSGENSPSSEGNHRRDLRTSAGTSTDDDLPDESLSSHEIARGGDCRGLDGIGGDLGELRLPHAESETCVGNPEVAVGHSGVMDYMHPASVSNKLVNEVECLMTEKSFVVSLDNNSNHMRDEDLGPKLKDEELAAESKDEEVVTESKDEELAAELKDEDLGAEIKDEELGPKIMSGEPKSDVVVYSGSELISTLAQISNHEVDPTLLDNKTSILEPGVPILGESDETVSSSADLQSMNSGKTSIGVGITHDDMEPSHEESHVSETREVVEMAVEGEVGLKDEAPCIDTVIDDTLSENDENLKHLETSVSCENELSQKCLVDHMPRTDENASGVAGINEVQNSEVEASEKDKFSVLTTTGVTYSENVLSRECLVDPTLRTDEGDTTTAGINEVQISEGGASGKDNLSVLTTTGTSSENVLSQEYLVDPTRRTDEGDAAAAGINEVQMSEAEAIEKDNLSVQTSTKVTYSENELSQECLVNATPRTDGSDAITAGISEVKKSEVEASKMDNHSVLTTTAVTSSDNENLCCSEDNRVRTGAAGDRELTDYENVLKSQEEVLDENSSFLTAERMSTFHVGRTLEKEGVAVVNAVVSAGKNTAAEDTIESFAESQSVIKSLEAHSSNENMSQSPEEVKLQKVGASFNERDAANIDPISGADVGTSDTATEVNPDVNKENNPIHYLEQKVTPQTDLPVNQEDSDEIKNPVNADNISNHGAADSSVSETSTVAGSQAGGGLACNCDSIFDIASNDVSLDKNDTVEICVPDLPSSALVNQAIEMEIDSCKPDDFQLLQADVQETNISEVQQGQNEKGSDSQQVDHGEREFTNEEHVSGSNQSEIPNEETKPVSFSEMYPGYLLPPENQSEFHISDLVWGKVRSHPWWPGQIFDAEDASEKAVKYFKKDSFLVAYFGDRTFAWNDASVLKPFRSHFSQIEKQSTSETFQNAVDCALEEVSRRVELGLACSCIAEDAYEKIEYQVVENTGIREESSKRYGVDKSTDVTSFEPHKLIEYIRQLAPSASSGGDRLDLIVAQAQLSAFSRFMGYRPPPEFLLTGTFAENDVDMSQLSDAEQKVSSHKRKLSTKDTTQPKKKEKSLSELMSDREYSPDGNDSSDGNAISKSVSSASGKKRKAVDTVTEGSDKRISIYAAKVSTTTSAPKPSFKIGECIQRVASQLTGSASVQRSNSDLPGTDVSQQLSQNSQRGKMTEFSSLNEMLLQLQLVARDPKKGYNFLNTTITFFSFYRNSMVSTQRSGRPNPSVGRPGRKKKASQGPGGSTEDFEFDDVNDSYWTDRIVQNYSEEQLLHNGENEGVEYHLAIPDLDKSGKSGRRSNSRKRYSTSNYEIASEEPSDYIDKEQRELLPAELILNFVEGDTLPSEINLNNMFRRFGPLKESDTEVDQDSGRAKVVFKRGSDAEVACSSAGSFNIFGSMTVSYQLNYSPSGSFKTSPLAISLGEEEIC